MAESADGLPVNLHDLDDDELAEVDAALRMADARNERTRRYLEFVVRYGRLPSGAEFSTVCGP